MDGSTPSTFDISRVIARSSPMKMIVENNVQYVPVSLKDHVLEVMATVRGEYLLDDWNCQKIMPAKQLFRVEFEVYGIVQGVFFRKFTATKANEITIRGYCMNTDRDTVRGVIEGTREKIDAMKHWLQTTGSPNSRIDKAEFKEQPISDYTFSNFQIRR